MPYVPSNPDDEEQRRLSGQPQEISGTAGDAAGGEGSQSFLSPQQSGTSGWTDVKAYLDANRDQAQGMAQNLAGKLSGEADALEGQIKQGVDTFRGKVDKSRVDLDEPFVTSALDNPAGFVSDDANVQRFHKMRDASYGGPMSLSDTDDFGTLNAKVQEGKTRAGMVETEGGRQTLLTERGTNPTKGQTTLDSLLLSGSPETLGILKTGVAKFGTLGSFLDEQNKAAEDYAKSAKEKTAATSKTVQDRLKKSTDDFSASLEQKVSTAKNDAKSNAAMLRDRVTKGESLTDDERAALGLNNWDDVLKTRDQLAARTPFSNVRVPYEREVDLARYLTEQNPDAVFSRENVATAEDYAKEAALQKLQGQGFDVLPTDTAQAGTAPRNILSVNGDPAGDLKNTLREIDASFIDQFKDYNLGAGTESDWQSALKDPKAAESYGRMLEIYRRNPDLLNPLQRGIADNLERWLNSGGDAFVEPPPTGSDRLRMIDGKMRWWDGKQWADKPVEVYYDEKSGQKMRFNYSTGQYERTSSDDGVMRKF